MGSGLLTDREYPTVASRLVNRRARDNRHTDPQGIERHSDASGMDGLDVRNAGRQGHQGPGLQVHGITDVPDGSVDLDRQRELRDVDVAVDVALSLLQVARHVILFLALNGRTAQILNGADEQFLMFLVIGSIFQSEREYPLPTSVWLNFVAAKS